MVNTTKVFWNTIKRNSLSCPNLSLFRFLNHLNIDIKNKEVLELGCGNCSDLSEMKKRGAKTYGLDIDKQKVDEINMLKNNHQLLVGDISTDINKFNKKFDLIFSQDTLYYLSEEELQLCFKGVKENLNDNGKLVFQVITGDYKIVKGKEIFDSKAILKNSGNPILFRNEDFYISYLEKEGFRVIGKKIIKETFFTKCQEIRHNLYLCCSKDNRIK